MFVGLPIKAIRVHRSNVDRWTELFVIQTSSSKDNIVKRFKECFGSYKHDRQEYRHPHPSCRDPCTMMRIMMIMMMVAMIQEDEEETGMLMTWIIKKGIKIHHG